MNDDRPPLPNTPPKPIIGRRKRAYLAAQWLRRMHQNDTPERIESLAPFVGRFHPRSRMGQAADSLVSNGQLPTRQAVEDEYLRRRQNPNYQQRRRRNTTTDGTAALLSDNAPARALTFIDDVNTTTGHGPTWNDLRRHMNWDRSSTTGAIHLLARRGQISFTKSQGSLKVTHAGPRPL